jgi:hypothetical protein
VTLTYHFEAVIRNILYLAPPLTIFAGKKAKLSRLPKIIIKVKLSLYLTKYYAMKACGGVDV